jgi:hypothetical protein
MRLPRLLLCLLLLTTSLQIAAASPTADAACDGSCAMLHDAAATQACDEQARCGDHESRCAGHCMPALSTSLNALPILTTGHQSSNPLRPVVDSPPTRLLRPPISA